MPNNKTPSPMEMGSVLQPFQYFNIIELARSTVELSRLARDIFVLASLSCPILSVTQFAMSVI